MSMEIKKVAVLGTGVMGSQIAAHLTNAGIEVFAFDMTQEVASEGIENCKKLKPSPYYNFKSSNFFEKGLVNEKKIKEHSKKILSNFSVNTDNVEMKSQFLSGGNLQKLIIGRE